MDAICQKHNGMIGPAVCLHCEIERLRNLLQNGSPIHEATIQHMAMEIMNLKAELQQARADALREAAEKFDNKYDFCAKDIDTDEFVYASDWLRRMADEIDGGKK